MTWHPLDNAILTYFLQKIGCETLDNMVEVGFKEIIVALMFGFWGACWQLSPWSLGFDHKIFQHGTISDT